MRWPTYLLISLKNQTTFSLEGCFFNQSNDLWVRSTSKSSMLISLDQALHFFIVASAFHRCSYCWEWASLMTACHPSHQSAHTCRIYLCPFLQGLFSFLALLLTNSQQCHWSMISSMWSLSVYQFRMVWPMHWWKEQYFFGFSWLDVQEEVPTVWGRVCPWCCEWCCWW